jgi:hypothetical protein
MSINLEQEHFVEPYNYVVWYDTSDATYKAKNGLTQEVDYDDADFSTLLEAVLAGLAAEGAGGLIGIRAGGYSATSTITIPKTLTTTTILGASGSGKNYSEGGSKYTGTHIKSTATPLFQTTYNDDLRNIGLGIHFSRIKFEGPDTDASVCMDMRNNDSSWFDRCYFLRWGTGIKVTYNGSVYPVAEQPGAPWIDDCVFSEGRVRYIHSEKATQGRIHGNIFGSFGTWNANSEYIYFLGTDKCHIRDNEFNAPMNYASAAQDINAFIELESTATEDLFDCSNINIDDNWFWRELNTYPVLATVGAGFYMKAVVMQDNTVIHGYDPNVDTDSYLSIGDDDFHFVSSDDFTRPFSEGEPSLKDMTATWTAGSTYTNNWSPFTAYWTVNYVGVADTAYIQAAAPGKALWTIAQTTGRVADDRKLITFNVATRWQWRMELTGTATTESLIVHYHQ